MEISSGCVCWRQESLLWQAILKNSALPWWVTVQSLELPWSMSCAYLLIFWLTLMNSFILFNHRILSKNIPFSRFLQFLLLSLQEVPKKIFQQSVLFLSTAIFMFIFVYLVNVYSILKCKNCVYLCIEDTIQIHLSLWYSYTHVHMYVHMYVYMCACM